MPSSPSIVPIITLPLFAELDRLLLALLRSLKPPAAAAAAASITLDPTTAWQVFTKALSPAEAWARATVVGEEALARPALGLVAVMA